MWCGHPASTRYGQPLPPWYGQPHPHIMDSRRRSVKDRGGSPLRRCPCKSHHGCHVDVRRSPPRSPPARPRAHRLSHRAPDAGRTAPHPPARRRRAPCRPAAAEDLVQATFERVLRRPRTVSGSEAAYLVQAVRNTHLSRLRSAASRVRTTALPEDFEPVDIGAEDRPMSARRAREVLDAVAALPKGFREAVVLVDVHGYRAGEAARALGIAEGTLHSRLHRGRTQVARACEA